MVACAALLSLACGYGTSTRTAKDIKSVYVTPTWVTTDNMADTVVKDTATTGIGVTASDLCTGAAAAACSAAGIK